MRAIAHYYRDRGDELGWQQLVVTCTLARGVEEVVVDGQKPLEDEDWTAYLSVIVTKPEDDDGTSIRIVVDAPGESEGATFDDMHPRSGDPC